MYDDKYVRRGEIYSVVQDNVLPGEQGATRPALIISNNIGNDTSPVVIVAYMTTRDHNIGIHYGPTKATGRPSYIQCEQIYTVSKQRLGRLMGSLTPNEMKEVEYRLDEVLDLGYVDDTPLKEKEREINALKLQMEELKSEVFRLKTSLDATRDDVLTRDVEIAVHKRMYEKAVGIIAAMRAEPDLPKPPEYVKKIEQDKVGKPVEPTKPVEEPKKPEPPKPKLVDINSATFAQLRGIGLSNNLVLAVINKRPFKKIEDLKKISGIKVQTYNIIEKKICCVPVKEEEVVVEEPKVDEVKKVNINTAKAAEIHEISGLCLATCYNITGYRKKNGPYEKLDDLLNVKNIYPGTIANYGHLMEV